MPQDPTDFDTSLQSPAQGLAILIANDDADAAEGMACHLREAGHRVRVARDGKSAFEVAQANEPDVAVLGEVPDLRGEQLAASLTRHGARKRPFLILISAKQPATGPGAEGIDLRIAGPVNVSWLERLLLRLQAIIKPGGDTPKSEVGGFCPALATCQ